MGDIPDKIEGPYGTAARVPRENISAPHPATLDCWIINAPSYHPLWSQYTLTVITLADVPGVPPAKKRTPEMTHELMVMALNPEHGPYEAEQVGEGTLHLLRPGNVAEQFTGTDEQATELAALAAEAVVHGRLNPETGDAPDRIRREWSEAVHDTLEHFRDPNHGQAR